VHLPRTKWRLTSMILALCLSAQIAFVCLSAARAQEHGKFEESSRKATYRVEPVYPDVALRMSITGTVRLAVTVAPNGKVKRSRPVGGHPLLVNAATNAVKQWKFEPASIESNEVVEFKFQPK
jgi:TonB family protein